MAQATSPDRVTMTGARNWALLAPLALVLALSIWLAVDPGMRRVFFPPGDWLDPMLEIAPVILLVLSAALYLFLPQRLVIDPTAIELVNWGFRRTRIRWGDVVHVRTYLDDNGLYLRIESDRAKILLTTGTLGWDKDDLRRVAFTVGRRVRKESPEAVLVDELGWMI